MIDADVMARTGGNDCAKVTVRASLVSPVSRYGRVLWLARPPEEREIYCAAAALRSSAEAFLAGLAERICEYFSKQKETISGTCDVRPRSTDEVVRQDTWEGRTPILHFRAHEIVCGDFRASHRIVLGVCTPRQDRGTTNHSKIWSRVTFCGPLSDFGWARFVSVAQGLNRHLVTGVTSEHYRSIVRENVSNARFATDRDYEVEINATNSADIEVARLLRALNLGHLTSIDSVAANSIWVHRLKELFGQLGYLSNGTLEFKPPRSAASVRKTAWLRVPGPETDALYYQTVTDECTQLVGVASLRDPSVESDSPNNPAYMSSGALEAKLGGFL